MKTKEEMAREKDCESRITNYLSSGGLFNPEFMEHEKVRDLLIDCRDRLEKAQAIIEKLEKCVEWYSGLTNKDASYSIERPYFYPILPFDDCDDTHPNSSKEYPMEVGGRLARQTLKEVKEMRSL